MFEVGGVPCQLQKRRYVLAKASKLKVRSC
jgi:hypothetical protein